MNINKYKSCSTCGSSYPMDCGECDSNYANWKRCSLEKALSNEPCVLCVYFVKLGEYESWCTSPGDCEFLLDTNALYELFPEMINVNKPTIKGILE